jgi:hypothetical protein
MKQMVQFSTTTDHNDTDGSAKKTDPLIRITQTFVENLHYNLNTLPQYKHGLRAQQDKMRASFTLFFN